ncbi:fibrous sheath CABYR-binding protein-like [Drosophila miranda]|uniref:fibrous sheath CABYR-binding protein-like n=1 Tax=Drosophila miranda TaxID=7229 RepID=UPI00143FA2B7|nr:fibrous sheath CABYR-binding protein-like [Drosophila miranda]
MAETINNKPSIQIRNGLPSPLPDKSPSPATKLLISHGKPNFTIGNKSPKAEDNGTSPLSPQQTANNNYNPYKSASNNGSNSNGTGSEINKFIVGTKFNGVFKPSTAATSWATATTNGNGSLNGNGAAAGGENEASKVVLRRPKAATSPPPAEAEDDNVPEFIRRQRRIQERLAKENVLDFENRRSGYFTHVVISPDSPNRTSFVETMASPAIVPSLEMPAPVHEKVGEEEEEEQKQQQEQEQRERATPVTTSALISEPETVAAITNGHSEESETTINGHADHKYVSPEEVAKAIEEVNKAVAGEDDDKPEAETPEPEAEPASAPPPVPVPVEMKIESEDESKPKTEEIIPATAARTPSPVEAQVEVVQHVQNGETAAATAAPATNGQDTDGITISHTNGQSSDGPSIPSPDPSGALGVNYEPKTVVSFSQELGGGENNYPDTVMVVTSESSDGELKDLAKLKFDIKNDGQADDVQVTPVLRAE